MNSPEPIPEQVKRIPIIYLFLRCSIAFLFPLFFLLLVAFTVAILMVFISNFSISYPISVPCRCKIVSSNVDLRSAKVCELGLLNYKAKHVFYPSEKKKFRCRYDYYWASVFEDQLEMDIPVDFDMMQLQNILAKVNESLKKDSARYGHKLKLMLGGIEVGAVMDMLLMVKTSVVLVRTSVVLVRISVVNLGGDGQNLSGDGQNLGGEGNFEYHWSPEQQQQADYQGSSFADED